MVKANINLEKNTIDKVSEILNRVLSDEYVLYTKTRNFHWNVTGFHFNDLHKFFEEQYEELNETIDEVAERIRMLGVYTKATMKHFLGNSSIKESEKYIDSNKMIQELLLDHEKIIGMLRKDIEIVGEIGDAGNDDFLTALLQKHEKMAWMLRSMIE